MAVSNIVVLLGGGSWLIGERSVSDRWAIGGRSGRNRRAAGGAPGGAELKGWRQAGGGFIALQPALVGRAPRLVLPRRARRAIR
jgi:hypothetical protein